MKQPTSTTAELDVIAAEQALIDVMRHTPAHLLTEEQWRALHTLRQAEMRARRSTP